MSNPTSNFGWQMPTATDLVTDLPADFEVFGQAVDTALMDLKGGTSGQVLKKNSNTDMDFVWGTDAAGMTNPMTTTGDTIYSSSGSTPARLGIGTTGQVLNVSGAGVPAWTSLGASAFVLIQRSTFTTVSNTSTTFDGVFTSTYKAYRIVFEAITSSDAPPVTLYWQWRKSGPTTHSANYYAGSSRVNFNGAETLAGNSNTTQYSLDAIGNTASNAYSFDVYRVGQGTSVQPLIYGMGTGYSGNIGPFTFGGTLDATINTTGFILSASAGTITGTVAIYGLAT
jgi:hypothetical protein